VTTKVFCFIFINICCMIISGLVQLGIYLFIDHMGPGLNNENVFDPSLAVGMFVVIWIFGVCCTYIWWGTINKAVDVIDRFRD